MSTDEDTTIVVGAHRLRFLRDGPIAFPRMLDAIRAARHEILLEMYWFAADTVGEDFRRALLERARAGVRIRVIYDSLGSFGAPTASWGPLRAAGVRVHEFSPMSPFRALFRVWRLWHRDHRKFLVVDDVVAFTGGMNLGDPWAPPTQPERAWRDDEIEIHGPAVSDFRRQFLAIWQRFEPLRVDDPREEPREPSSDAKVVVLANRLGRAAAHVIRHAYVETTRRATRSIDISNPYFLPGPILLHALRLASRRGCRVRILLPEHSDVGLVALAMTSLYTRLLRDGVELYAYRPTMMHAKTAIFDARWTTMGSHNLDSLSWHFNLECNVLIDSEEFAQLASRSFERDIARAKRLDLVSELRRGWWSRAAAWFVALFRYFL